MSKTKKKIKQKVHWQPNPGPQTFALTRTESEILFGGARGGGKTDASIAWLSRWINNPKLRFLIIRRNSGDLRDWIDRAKTIWKPTGAEFVLGEVRFPSGAKGIFGHLHDDDAYERYQGHEYQKMVIEELTHIPSEELYLKLISSCRSTVEGLKPQVFSTTNPGNSGHLWVKKRFVDATEPCKSYTDVHGRTRIYVPARVEDNPVLMEKDPGYIQFLESLSEELRKAWREGSWETFEVKGAYYAKWINEARKEGRITSVPYEKALPVHTWWDLGVGDATSIGFFQLYGREWRMIDFYESSGEGLAFYKEILNEKGYIYGRHFAPHDIEVREFTTGVSRLKTAKELGIKFEIVSKHSIEEGIHAVRLKFNQLWIDQEKCQRFLDAIAQYRKSWDEKNNCFKNKPVHDWTSHAADMLRYWAMTKFVKERAGRVYKHGY